MTDFLALARQLVGAGIVPLPVSSDGSKRPDVRTWTEYQHREPTDTELLAWFGMTYEVAGIGLVCGDVSGGLVLCEIEGRMIERYDQIVQRCQAAGVGDILTRIDSYRERSPSGGLHWLYRIAGDRTPGNTKLARNASGEVTIETRGEGGFVVVAPSTGRAHPLGQPWQLVHGDLTQLAVITAEDNEALWDVLRSFDETPAPSRPAAQPRPRESSHSDLRPGDDYAYRTTWQEILEPHGWVFLFEHGDEAYWRRPGKTAGISATTNYAGSDSLKVFSSSAYPFEADTAYSKFGAYAILNHNGDQSAAASELRHDGYGSAYEPTPSPWPIDDWTTDDELNAPEEGAIPARAAALRASRLGLREVIDSPPSQHLIADVLTMDSLAVLYGQPAGGKTFAMIDAALCIATGTEWHGHAVQAGPVMYLAGEGKGGYGRRFAAWCQAQGYQGDAPDFYLYNYAVPLLEKEWTAEADGVVWNVNEIRPVLVVIDTLSRSMAGGDENEAKDMTAVIKAADRIRAVNGCTVVVVHHTPKAGGAIRGHSSLLGAVDTAIEAKGTRQKLTLSCTKQKDSEGFDDLVLWKQVVEMADTSSLVLTDRIPDGMVEEMDEGDTPADVMGEAWRWLLRMWPDGVVPASTVRDAMMEGVNDDGLGVGSKATAYRRIADLVRLGALRVDLALSSKQRQVYRIETYDPLLSTVSFSDVRRNGETVATPSAEPSHTPSHTPESQSEASRKGAGDGGCVMSLNTGGSLEPPYEETLTTDSHLTAEDLI